MQEQQDRERERVLKAKDYARKQREIIKSQAKKVAAPEESHHVHFKKDVEVHEVIQEVSEEQNESSALIGGPTRKIDEEEASKL